MALPNIGATLDRLGKEASIIDLTPSQAERVRTLVEELESFYNQAKHKLAS